MTKRCVGFTSYDPKIKGMQCPLDSDRTVTIVCVHEHLREIRLCEFCADKVEWENSQCWPCMDSRQPHGCNLKLLREVVDENP